MGERQGEEERREDGRGRIDREMERVEKVGGRERGGELTREE